MIIYKNGILLLASIIFSLLLCEAILRFFEIGYGNAPLETSEVFHHAHPKNYSFRMHDPNGEYGGFMVYYDESGYRVQSKAHSNFIEKDAPNTIIFMGDSFTEANQVAFDETFVANIGKLTGKSVINMGVSSYSPILYLLQAQHELKNLEAKTVIMQIFRNDFVNDKTYLNNAIRDKHRVLAISGGKNSFFIKALRKSFLVRFLRKSQLTMMAVNDGKVTKTDHVLEDSKIEERYEQNIATELIKSSADTIAKIRDELRLQGKHLHVFMIPSKALSLSQECCEADTVSQLFKNEMRKRQINYFDIDPLWSLDKNQKETFFHTDIHLTPRGHDLLAALLYSEIMKINK